MSHRGHYPPHGSLYLSVQKIQLEQTNGYIGTRALQLREDANPRTKPAPTASMWTGKRRGCVAGPQRRRCRTNSERWSSMLDRRGTWATYYKTAKFRGTQGGVSRCTCARARIGPGRHIPGGSRPCLGTSTPSGHMNTRRECARPEHFRGCPPVFFSCRSSSSGGRTPPTPTPGTTRVCDATPSQGYEHSCRPITH